VAIAIEGQQRVAAQDWAHRRVGLPGGENIAITVEDLLDRFGIGNKDYVAERVEAHGEDVAIATAAMIHSRS
jgi:hypothetical protein